jgi:hypothetical protein
VPPNLVRRVRVCLPAKYREHPSSPQLTQALVHLAQAARAPLEVPVLGVANRRQTMSEADDLEAEAIHPGELEHNREQDLLPRREGLPDAPAGPGVEVGVGAGTYGLPG